MIEGLSEAGHRLLESAAEASVVTLNPDGSPHVSSAWVCVEDGEVFCPWHGWRFRLSDGKWADNPRLGIDVFETRVVGDEVQVRVGGGK